MAVVFTDNRLLVGYRGRDWAGVWYEAGEDPDEDGNYPSGLHASSSGTDHQNEPMASEVYFLPHFDAARCEAQSIVLRRKLQQQIMYNAWTYMSEKDPKRVEELEEGLHDPNSRRWQSWFNMAKKLKRSKMNAAETRNRNGGKKPKPTGRSDEHGSDVDSAFGGDQVRPDRGGLSGDGPVGKVKPKSGSKGMRSASGQSHRKQKRRIPFEDAEASDEDDDISSDRQSKRFGSHGLRFSPEDGGKQLSRNLFGEGSARDSVYDTQLPLTPPLGDESLGNNLRPLSRPAPSFTEPDHPRWESHPLFTDLQTPRSQTNSIKSQWAERNGHLSEEFNKRGNAKVIDAGRALEKSGNSGDLVQQYNGSYDQDQVMRDGLQRSTESMAHENGARESVAPQPSNEGPTVKAESNDGAWD